MTEETPSFTICSRRRKRRCRGVRGAGLKACRFPSLLIADSSCWTGRMPSASDCAASGPPGPGWSRPHRSDWWSSAVPRSRVPSLNIVLASSSAGPAHSRSEQIDQPVPELTANGLESCDTRALITVSVPSRSASVKYGSSLSCFRIRAARFETKISFYLFLGFFPNLDLLSLLCQFFSQNGKLLERNGKRTLDRSVTVISKRAAPVWSYLVFVIVLHWCDVILVSPLLFLTLLPGISSLLPQPNLLEL